MNYERLFERPAAEDSQDRRRRWLLRPRHQRHPFLKTAERLGSAPALCLASEDSCNGVHAASNAGTAPLTCPS